MNEAVSMINDKAFLYILATGQVATRKKFLRLFSCCFTIVTGERIVDGFDDNTKHSLLCLSFPGSQAKFNWVSKIY